MAVQTTFKRYEYKYLLTAPQKQALLQAMAEYMRLDEYGRATIRNLYYDTENFRLIRRSLEKPSYKEKLRIRSYRQATETTPVFVELKKKYSSVVYKRRLSLPEHTVTEALSHDTPLPVSSQIGREIEYFRTFYEKLVPAVFLSYEREAYYALDGSDFRVTFDENILYRQEELSLCSGVYGTPILAPGQTLMELKTAGGIPLWMTQVLTEQKLFRTSFSKYGLAYLDIQNTHAKGEVRYA